MPGRRPPVMGCTLDASRIVADPGRAVRGPDCGPAAGCFVLQRVRCKAGTCCRTPRTACPSQAAEDPVIAGLTKMISARPALRRASPRAVAAQPGRETDRAVARTRRSTHVLAFVAARNRGVTRRGSEETNTPANVREIHSVRTDGARVRFCTLSARCTGAVVQRLGGENTPRRCLCVELVSRAGRRVALRPHYTANSLPEPAAWSHYRQGCPGPDYSYSHPLRRYASVEVSEIRQPVPFGPGFAEAVSATCGGARLRGTGIRCRRKPTRRVFPKKVLLQRNSSRAAPRRVLERRCFNPT